ncbi:MAG TPA: hypothetical protein VIL30_16015 [Ramlibacter sp.]|jgi:uncharacterized protein involved in outer membrane biogenesis
MAKLMKWLAVAAAVVALLLIGVAVALQQWLRTDDFRGRVEREAMAALGVPLKLGRLSVDLWPLPAVAADQVVLHTRPAITVERVEARPVWTALLARRLEIATLLVRQAVLPQTALAGLGAALQKQDKPARSPAPAQRGDTVVWPRHAVLDQVTWIDDKGQRSTADAKARLGRDGLLDEASFRIVAGRFAGTKGEIRREADHWPLQVQIGGGRIHGKLELRPSAKGAQLLQGQLQVENVELSALTAPSRMLTGKLEAQTSLRAEFREPGQIGDALQTQTRFSVREAVVQGIDLARAVQTVGLSRGGSTRLDTLAGQVSTTGRAVHLGNLVATSGVLAASGDVFMSATKALSGRVSVDLQSTGVGVPLALGGTVDAPSVTLGRGALVGAAVGTLLAPGAAASGSFDKLKGLFGR